MYRSTVSISLILSLLVVGMSLPSIAQAQTPDDGKGPQPEFEPANQDQCETRTISGHTVWRNGSCECQNPSDHEGTLVVDEGDDGNVGYPYCPESGGDGPSGGDGGAGTVPVEPGGGGGGSQGTPEPPTITQCAAAGFTCAAKVQNEFEQCMESEKRKAQRRVDDNTGCYGVPADFIWNSREVRVAGAVISCNDISSFEESKIGRLCTNEFRRSAMGMCRNGNTQLSQSDGSGSGGSVGYETESGFKAEWTSTIKIEVKESITANLGYADACHTARDKGEDQCEAAGKECFGKVAKPPGSSGNNTQSMQFVFAEAIAPSLADTAYEDQLLSRVDRVLLGLEKESSGSGLSALKDRLKGKAPGSRPVVFRPINQRPQESSYWYRKRLEFLVNWSDFVKRHSLPKTTQTSIQKAFISAQRAFVDEWEYEGNLISMRFVTDALTGEEGLGDSVAIYDSYLNRGGSAATIARAESDFRAAVETLLTDQQFSDFTDRVWKDVPHIGVSGPMNLARQVNKSPENNSVPSAARCSRASENTCGSNGATCDVIDKTDGSPRELCRWESISTEAACSKTPGLWTKTNSRYAKNHPDAVPKGKSGACISEAANLSRKR